ncbi:MAG: hypothetical protein A2X86_20145 [Bdellovibrionales bacterium GWA2_49_15]|nr:MAG: hypothetical protein A2X86_20145 [Bdellovibrionales bacterium GWA2_49_15]HAZ11376.1 hypothetical protein [Bdellovibrionales bacterium]
MDELILETTTPLSDESTKLFNLVRLDDSSEGFELMAGQDREISQGLFLKVDSDGNGILELNSDIETNVKISGKRVEEVAQFQENDLISIGDKEFLLCPQEGAVINPRVGEEELAIEDAEKLSLQVKEENKNETGERKQKRKNIFSLFIYGIFCMIIATSGFLLFMNSKIGDYNRIAAMANLFQQKMTRLLNQRPKEEIKPIQLAVEQLFKEEPPPTPEPEISIIKKKRKLPVKTAERKIAPPDIVHVAKDRTKPSMIIGQKDREHVLKEIEMLKLEYRLDPYHVRKSLQEMRDSISDRSLRRKIDTVLQQL